MWMVPSLSGRTCNANSEPGEESEILSVRISGESEILSARIRERYAEMMGTALV